jgi:hypothetical protein
MADLPLELADPLAAELARVLDVEGKIPRALESLGPLSGCDVVLVGGGPARLAQLRDGGSNAVEVDWQDGRLGLADGSADVVLGCWSVFRGVEPAEVAECDRVLRPGGRLLVVHDYGRDDVSTLRGDLPEYGAWSRRDGPFLGGGFRIRVIHCWWTFADVPAAKSFLEAAFGEPGRQLGERLTRPRLSDNVAVYHRSRPDGAVA